MHQLPARSRRLDVNDVYHARLSHQFITLLFLKCSGQKSAAITNRNWKNVPCKPRSHPCLKPGFSTPPTCLAKVAQGYMPSCIGLHLQLRIIGLLIPCPFRYERLDWRVVHFYITLLLQKMSLALPLIPNDYKEPQWQQKLDLEGMARVLSEYTPPLSFGWHNYWTYITHLGLPTLDILSKSVQWVQLALTTSLCATDVFLETMHHALHYGLCSLLVPAEKNTRSPPPPPVALHWWATPPTS